MAKYPKTKSLGSIGSIILGASGGPGTPHPSVGEGASVSAAISPGANCRDGWMADSLMPKPQPTHIWHLGYCMLALWSLRSVRAFHLLQLPATETRTGPEMSLKPHKRRPLSWSLSSEMRSVYGPFGRTDALQIGKFGRHTPHVCQTKGHGSITRRIFVCGTVMQLLTARTPMSILI